MEFLKECPEIANEAQKLISKFEDQVETLKKSDVEKYMRKIEEATDLQLKSNIMRTLIEINLPASALLLDRLLEKDKKETLKYLEWLSHRHSVSMSLESFTKAREIAEKAYTTAKNHYTTSSHMYMDANISSKSAYKAYIKACVNLMLVCRYQGKLSEAETFLKEAEIASKKGDLEDQHLLRILHGDILLARGQLNNAIDNYFMPLLRTQNLSNSNRGILLQKLGNACRSAARWGSAKDYLRKSIRIAGEMGDKISEYDRATDLGNVYRSEGRIADALQQQITHMTFAFNRGDFWGLTVACFNMGFAYYSITPHPDLRRALILLSVKHDLATRTDNEPLRGMALNNLGKVFCARGEYEMALKVMSQSVEVAKKTLNLAGEGMAYGNIGTAYRSLQKYEEAIVNHTKYLKNASDRGDDGGAAIMLRELTIDYICQGDLEKADEKVREAISTLEMIRSKLGSEDSSKIANFDKNQAETYSLLQVILARRGKFKEALALSELARSRALTDIIRDKLVRTSGTTDSSWIFRTDFGTKWDVLADEVLSDFISTANTLSTNFLVYSVLKDYDGSGVAQQWLYIWVVLNEEAASGKDQVHFRRVLLNEAIPSDLISDSGFFASLTRSFRLLSEKDAMPSPQSDDTPDGESKEEDEENVTPKILESPEVKELLELLKSLSLSGVVEENVDHAAENGGTEAKLFRDGKENPHQETPRNTGEENELDDAEEFFLERYMEQASWDKEGVKRLLLLYRICIEPIEECLPRVEGEIAPKVTIIPHEFLFSVPFCCLHNNKQQYLVEKFVLNYAPSIRALRLLNCRLRYLKERQGQRKLKLLAMGNPTIILPDLPQLPRSGEEAQNVVTVFGSEQCRLALRKEATKKLLLTELKNIDILHVATHASPENRETGSDKSQGDYSMKGCLIMAISDDDFEGILRANEIASAECTCQLVNLSCCETGLGKVTGDGVVGLYRAFFAAGAASVLVTLWKIRDDITPIFMERFYRELKVTTKVSSSLRSAMLYCIYEKKLPPQQWAAFSFIGSDS